MRKVSIIGVGRLGGALAVALARKGYRIENLIVRNDRTALKAAALIDPKPKIISSENLAEITSDIVLITTPDGAIEKVASKLAATLRHQPQVFHTSGALSSEVLQPLREIGCPAGSIHPLVSVSEAVPGAERLAGAYFCVEGDAPAVRAAKQMVADLGGRAFSIETKYKTLYHAAAVTACGHLVAVIDTAIEMLRACGLDESIAQKTLLPLIESTVENLATQTTSQALTGTFARADVGTFEKHLAALENVSGEAREIYLQLGARSAHLAERQGASPENLKEILNKISLAKKNFKC